MFADYGRYWMLAKNKSENNWKIDSLQDFGLEISKLKLKIFFEVNFPNICKTFSSWAT